VSEANPKFPRPKALAIDLAEEVVRQLVDAGFNVNPGTFGRGFKVPESAAYYLVHDRARLPNHTEQEIVIADLRLQLDDVAPPEISLIEGERGTFARRNLGLIDPRPVGMVHRRADFDRIYEHGGCFVLFAAPRFSNDLRWARQGRHGLYDDQSLDWDNWSFLTRLGSVQVTQDRGTELVEPSSGGESFFSPHLGTASFLCTLGIDPYHRDEWILIATNKFEQPVAAALAPQEDSNEGWIFLLPEVEDRGDLLLALLQSVIPTLCPELFPHFEGDQWTRRREYELSEVVPLKGAIERALEEARAKTAELEELIKEKRRQHGFQHDLLTKQGDELVVAVNIALESIGFADVRDIDEEGEAAQKREDLQIHDGSPTLLVEVKGLSGVPKESESMQVLKYVLPRIREWGRTDVQGLSIINHQKNLPGLSREDEHVFQDDVITNAEEEFGLMTTWDLYRLIRNAGRLGWKGAELRPLFYNRGRIRPIPTSYEHVGTVEDFWEKAGALSIRLAASIAVGDILAFEGKVDIHEEEVTSLQLDDEAVERAESGVLAGVATHLPKEQARPGSRVFRVSQ
jgi:hypothetical protein